jgi:hypothetical protein
MILINGLYIHNQKNFNNETTLIMIKFPLLQNLKIKKEIIEENSIPILK